MFTTASVVLKTEPFTFHSESVIVEPFTTAQETFPSVPLTKGSVEQLGRIAFDVVLRIEKDILLRASVEFEKSNVSDDPFK